MFNRFAIDKSLVVNDVRFHYRDWGGKGWPILFLHRLGATGHTWNLVAPLLLDTARVLALDLRGHGLSDKPDSTYDFATVAADVLGMLEELEFTCPLVVGHAWGAEVGLYIGAKHKNTISGLIMIDGGIVDLSVLSWDKAQREYRRPTISGTPVEEFREKMLAEMPQGIIAPAVEAAIMANVEIDGDNAVQSRLPREYYGRVLRSIWEQSLGELYDEIEAPVLIMPTRLDGEDAPAYLARKELGLAQAEERIVDIEVAWLTDSIHDAPLHHPHKIAEQIKRFLQERI